MENKFIIETSARHIHLTKEALAILCGEGYELEVKKMLSQPGQYVSTLRLDLVGPKSTIKGVSILGPVRSSCQVEVSATDARSLGIKGIIRESGDVKGSSPITLFNPLNNKELVLDEGVLVAKRHIHMTPPQAQEFNVTNGEIVSVKLNTPDRSLVFGDVVVRVNETYDLAMHIDTDEANAAGCQGEVFGEIVK